MDVFVGPEEAAALHGLAIPDAALGFDDPALTSARLTVLLAPLVPLGEAVRAELDVPRVGRSPNARLEWTLPEKGLVQARLAVIHRNRVLQTVRITGRIGAPARVTDRIVLWDQIGRLDERQPFDRTFVLNHAANGRSRASATDGQTTIDSLVEIEAAADSIRDYLLEATMLRSKGAKGRCRSQAHPHRRGRRRARHVRDPVGKARALQQGSAHPDREHSLRPVPAAGADRRPTGTR